MNQRFKTAAKKPRARRKGVSVDEVLAQLPALGGGRPAQSKGVKAKRAAAEMLDTVTPGCKIDRITYQLVRVHAIQRGVFVSTLVSDILSLWVDRATDYKQELYRRALPRGARGAVVPERFPGYHRSIGAGDGDFQYTDEQEENSPIPHRTAQPAPPPPDPEPLPAPRVTLDQAEAFVEPVDPEPFQPPAEPPPERMHESPHRRAAMGRIVTPTDPRYAKPFDHTAHNAAAARPGTANAAQEYSLGNPALETFEEQALRENDPDRG